MSGMLIVGSRDCPVKKVVKAMKLKSSPEAFTTFTAKWEDVAGRLGVVCRKSQGKELTYYPGYEAEVVGRVIEDWIEMDGRYAKLGQLIRAIKNCGLADCAEAIMKEFKAEEVAVRMENLRISKHDAIFEAVEDGDVDLVEALAQDGARVNGTNDLDETPLHIAAKSHPVSMAMIKCLISNGSSMRRATKEGWTFFEKVAPKITPAQFHDFCEFVFSKECDDSDREWFSTTKYATNLLQIAVKHLDLERRTLKFLMEKRVNFDVLDYDRNSLLHIAVKGGRSADLVADLIEICEVNPGRRNGEGRTVYRELVEEGFGDNVAKRVREILREYR